MTDMQAASSLGAKTVRACDSCIRRRAQWFCAADDAFLCHGCDTLVHSANELASRHERVRLQTASSKVTTWHSGFTRKARTPRHNTNNKLQNRLKDQVLFNNACVLPLVPELGGEESLVVDNDEAEEQLLCRVPVFDAEPCNVYDMKNDDLDSFSDMDFAVFAADVESLLGSTDSCEVLNDESVMVKVKSEEEEEEIDDDIACHVESVLDMTKEDEFRWNSIDSVLSGAREENNKEEGVVVESNGVCVREEAGGTKRDIFLRLNYDEVINAWASQGSSPWTTPNPPKFNNDYDLSLGSSGGDWEVRTLWGKLDGGREARVSRYREKRRTRLFAKKIRYEVRKLNAEKRPRMKGRFVKRTCFVGATASPPYH